MIAFQSKIADSELLVQRYSYQEHERTITKRVTILGIFTAGLLIIVSLMTIQMDHCKPYPIIFFCKSDQLKVSLNNTLPDFIVFVWVLIVYSIILLVFYRRLKNNLDAKYQTHKWDYATQAAGMMTFIILKIALDFLLYHYS
jgi:hypothetical protein